jgi:XisH protein/XisI protein
LTLERLLAAERGAEKIAIEIKSFLTRIRGLNPPPLGGLFLGWGLNPHPKNLAFNFQLSTFNFLKPSTITDFYGALGQFLSYRLVLEALEPDRLLYMAVPLDAYQKNLTDRDPAEELVNMGVPKGDIILGLQMPSKRLYTDYGVA